MRLTLTEPKDCEQKDCGAPADRAAFWPGQTRLYCLPCAERASRLANAMGFELTVLPIRVLP